jgi:hypothetical protein
MAGDKKKSIFRMWGKYAVDVLGELIKENPDSGIVDETKPENMLDQISLEDLKRKKIGLEQDERMMLLDLREIEKDKRKLFDEGTKNYSNTEREIIANKIKRIEGKATNIKVRLDTNSQKQEVIEGLIDLKREATLLTESTGDTFLGNYELGEFLAAIHKLKVEGEYNRENVRDLLAQVRKDSKTSSEIVKDPEIQKIVEAMQRAGASNSQEEFEEKFQKFNEETAAIFESDDSDID